MENQKAIIYLRVSDRKQIENTSLDTQQNYCVRLCGSEKMTIVEVNREEGISAKASNTKRIVELLDFCKKNRRKFNVLVVYKTDRFARSQAHHWWLREKLLAMGILLRSATEKLGESPADKFFEGILAARNEYDNEIRQERAIDGMSARIMEGLWPWQPTVGYYLPKKEGVRLCTSELDEMCCKDILDVFKLFDANNYNHVEIAKIMNQRKVVNYRGVRVRFYDQMIHRILKNPFYIGLCFNPFDKKIYPGKHEPLVDIELWKRVQTKIAQKLTKGRRPKTYNPSFPLRNFLWDNCGACYTGAITTGGNGTHYPYYFCPICRAPSYEADFVHRAFCNYMKKMAPKPYAIKLFIYIVRETFENEQVAYKMQQQKLQQGLERLAQRKDRLLEGYLDGLIDKSSYEIQKLKLEQDMTLAIKPEIQHPGMNVERVTKDAEAFLLTLSDTWEVSELAERRQIISSIFPKGLDFDGEKCRTRGSPLVLELISQGYGSKLHTCEPGADRTHDTELKRLLLYH